MRTPPLAVWTVAAFLLGTGLMLASEHPLTLVPGVVLLLAFVVLGVFAIASPGYLADSEEDPPRRGPS